MYKMYNASRRINKSNKYNLNIAEDMLKAGRDNIEFFFHSKTGHTIIPGNLSRGGTRATPAGVQL